MPEPDLRRMRAYADAAREHPTWSVAYAEDVPILLAEIDYLRFGDDRSYRLRKAESDLTLAHAEVVRLRAWLRRISDRVDLLSTGEPLKTWVAQAVAGEKP